jgi:hypothetical protein
MAGAHQIPKRSPLITVKTVVTSGETSHQLRLSTSAVMVECNEDYGIRVAWATGEVDNASGNWFLLRPGAVYWEEDIFVDPVMRVLYLRTDSGSTTRKVAVLEWT